MRRLTKRINDLLYLEQMIAHAIHEEIENTERVFVSSEKLKDCGDIFDRINYIVEEQKNLIERN
jgi:hypothetical protein